MTSPCSVGHWPDPAQALHSRVTVTPHPPSAPAARRRHGGSSLVQSIQAPPSLQRLPQGGDMAAAAGPLAAIGAVRAVALPLAPGGAAVDVVGAAVVLGEAVAV